MSLNCNRVESKKFNKVVAERITANFVQACSEEVSQDLSVGNDLVVNNQLILGGDTIIINGNSDPTPVPIAL